MAAYGLYSHIQSNKRRSIALLLGLFFLVYLLVFAGALVAERISDERFDALAPGGPDADAGVGDYALSNGIVCAAIAAPAHETFLSPTGGTLIDLGHCGRADDQWSSLHGLPDFDRKRALPIASVRVEVASGEARAISEGEGGGLHVRITHALSAAKPTTLRVTTELTRLAGSDRVFGYAELARAAQASAAELAECLRRCDGNVTRAAEKLGIPRQSLQKMVKRLGLREGAGED